MCVSFANLSASNGSPVSAPLGLRVRLVAFGPTFADAILGIRGFFCGGAFDLTTLGLGFVTDTALRFCLVLRGCSSPSSLSAS